MSAVQRNQEELHQTNGKYIPRVSAGSICVILMNTIHKEAQLLGFHNHADAHKCMINNCNHIAWLRTAHCQQIVQKWKWIV